MPRSLNLLLSLVLISLALWLSPPSYCQTRNAAITEQSSKSRFAACHTVSQQINRSVKRHFPKGFQKPEAWKAQLYQESLCNSKAVSPAGAKGIAQIMDPTARDLARIFGVEFDPFSSMAIDFGAYYQARQMRVFKRRRRTNEQTWPLGLAAYNSGLGNVLKAQKACGGARLWDEIARCQYLITGPSNAHETLTYVTRIKRFRAELEKEL